MPDILHEVTIQAPPEKVYAALTEQAGLAKWWTANATAKPEVGSTAEFAFDKGIKFQFLVRTLEKGMKVHWDVEGGGPPDWAGTRVTWDLTPVEEGTKLLFGHRDYAMTEGSFASVSYNWAWFLTSLKQYIETGRGTPYMDM